MKKYLSIAFLSIALMTTEGFRATTGFPGGLFPTCGRQTPLYHGSVFGELSGSAELAEERTAFNYA